MSIVSTPKAIAYLRSYQKWLRGETDEPQPDPIKVGACIDVVLDSAESAEHAKAERNKEHVYTNAAKKLLFEAQQIMRRWGFLCPNERESWDLRVEECLCRRSQHDQAPNAKADLAPASGAQVQRLDGQTEPREMKP
jgi:hypothetical protein